MKWKIIISRQYQISVWWNRLWNAMNADEMVSGLGFLDLKDLLFFALSPMDIQSKAVMQKRGSGLRRLYPPWHYCMLMLFDGESPLRCTAVDILVFFVQVFSPHLAPHLVCVRLIFNDDEKHLGWPNGCVQNNEGSDNDAHGKTSSHPRGSTAMKCGRSTLNINMNKTQ